MEEIVRPEPDTHLERTLDPRGWSRDLAIVGASTSMVLPVLTGESAGLALAVAAIGATLGALLGRAVPALLTRHVRRLPLVVLALAGAGLGANWGALVAVLALLTLGASSMWSVELGAQVFMIQLGWFWIPAVWLRARGKVTWPLVLLVIGVCPLIAVALAR